MEPTDPIVIVAAARTPIGDLLGRLSPLKAPELGALAIQSALSRASLSADQIDEVLMGCVLTAGLGQAPARQASIGAGIPASVPCTTVNKVCGSGMKTVMLAHDALILGPNRLMVAGGMESMSNSPYLLDKARQGYRLGHQQITDAMYLDGLEDAYEKGLLMGVFAERTAEKFKLSREAQDAFAKTSLERARKAIEQGWFNSDCEVFSLKVKPPKGEAYVFENDEHPFNVNPDKIPKLKPSFKENGTITPANSSAISDGAAALVLTRLSHAKKLGLTPIAKILGMSTYAGEPAWFTTAPIYALQILLKKLNWTAQTPDLYEINEAFACVPMVVMKELNLSHDKINVHGGACALGHPIGASGARIMCTLLAALKHQQKSLGIASLCIGGGEATAIALERL